MDKECLRHKTESELGHLRQEIVLLGEMNQRYREQLQRQPMTNFLQSNELFQQSLNGETAGEILFWATWPTNYHEM